MKAIVYSLSLLALGQLVLAANLTLVKEYVGKTFFDDWDYDGTYDSTTHGMSCSLSSSSRGPDVSAVRIC